MATEAVSMEETINIIKSLTSAYRSTECMLMVQPIERMKSDVLTVLKRKESECAARVRDMEAKVQRLRDSCKRDISEEEFVAQLDEIAQERRDILAALDEYKIELNSTEEQCTAARSERDLLQRQYDAALSERNASVAPIKNELSLYVNVTKIQWDFESTMVKGRVILNNDVRPFSLDSNKHSQFVITNYLWDLLA
jgi:hypothetical protein